MTSRRTFIKTSILAGLSMSVLPDVLNAAEPWSKKKKHGWKHWVWINPKEGELESELAIRYKKILRSRNPGHIFRKR